MKILRIALGQINPTVGDLKNNTKKIVEYIKESKGYDADIVVFPELAITGYPPEDLLFNKNFIKENIAYRDSIVPHTAGIVAVVGFVDSINTGRGKGIYNAAAVIADGNIIDTCHKATLNGQNIYDESRYFAEGKGHPLYNIGGFFFSVAIGNDMPHNTKLIINIDASPYCVAGNIQKEKMLRTKALRTHAYVAYVNMVGGQDEWVFDGGSTLIDKNGQIVAKSPLFEEDLLVGDIGLKNITLESGNDIQTIRVPVKPNKKKKPVPKIAVKQLDPIGEVYNALVLGTRDYMRKNGFQKAVLGLSGGIDSALVAVIAKDALGKDNVIGISMPSQYTSEGSRTDTARLVKNLGITLIDVPIDMLFEAYLKTLKKPFKGLPAQLAQENIQPRIRANILMAFSNNYGWLVLATGNKSEVGSGYSTLYGDTAGGFAVIKDISKTLVYKLSQWVNKRDVKEVIPASILTKAPSAELKHNQKDTDTLPPYELLDPILTAYVEDKIIMDELTSSGHDAELVKTIMDMVHKNEYKRKQSPIGPTITKRSFGKGWNLPITNKYRF